MRKLLVIFILATLTLSPLAQTELCAATGVRQAAAKNEKLQLKRQKLQQKRLVLQKKRLQALQKKHRKAN
jgi:hypothetical protein